MKKIIAFLMAAIMMMSVFSSYACIAASAAPAYETISVSDIFGAVKEKQTAQKAEAPDKEAEEEPVEETSDLNLMQDIRNFIHRVIEIIKAVFSFFITIETPEPEII
ncbi:MAG: hypothetical protein IJK60_00370 [Clostridia bacterium]|nr:hypothetical protein [Clostridia bacterium]